MILDKQILCKTNSEQRTHLPQTYTGKHFHTNNPESRTYTKKSLEVYSVHIVCCTRLKAFETSRTNHVNGKRYKKIDLAIAICPRQEVEGSGLNPHALLLAIRLYTENAQVQPDSN
jgi:hypothetical protein